MPTPPARYNRNRDEVLLRAGYLGRAAGQHLPGPTGPGAVYAGPTSVLGPSGGASGARGQLRYWPIRPISGAEPGTPVAPGSHLIEVELAVGQWGALVVYQAVAEVVVGAGPAPRPVSVRRVTGGTSAPVPPWITEGLAGLSVQLPEHSASEVEAELAGLHRGGERARQYWPRIHEGDDPEDCPPRRQAGARPARSL